MGGLSDVKLLNALFQAVMGSGLVWYGGFVLFKRR